MSKSGKCHPEEVCGTIGKSNCYLDAEKSQSNPIYKIAVDILKHTNFFRAFTASSTIPAIYIQQFWDTICYDRTDGGYKCQLDEEWFNLTKDTLRDALQITPVNNNKAFSSPPTQDTLINFVSGLGYPKEGFPLTERGFGDLEADTQRAIKESLKDAHGAHRGPLPPVVFRETDTGKFQPLPEVEGKGKEKVSAEQAARVLLNLQTPKKKSPTEQYIFQRRTSVPTEPSGHDESSSLYAELGLTESDMESDEEVPPVVKNSAPNEGQAGPNPDAEAIDVTSQPQPGQMDEEFTATAYPNVQENLKLTVDASDSREPATLRDKNSNNILADLVDANQALEERLDKHGSRLYRLENQDIPNQVSKAVDEIVTDAVDWAMHAPPQGTLQDLPEADMKEFFSNRIWEPKSNQTPQRPVMKIT
ncbi:hypothetical protein Tco_0703095 [Tanacetum coccineum]|uniref:Uncharacterized protein n=1 Tax=Tanacetum coccineum TaxID=301880 RepID=A0ABQ4XXV6_9ASTR